MESVPHSARTLGLATVSIVYDRRRRGKDLHIPKGGSIHGPGLDFPGTEENPAEGLGGLAWQASCLLTAKAFMAEHLRKLGPCEK